MAPRGWAPHQNVFCSANIRPGLARDQQGAFTLAPSSSEIYTLQSGILLRALRFCLCLGAQKASGLLLKTLTAWPSCLGRHPSLFDLGFKILSTPELFPPAALHLDLPIPSIACSS